jgi:hypothetical protein
VQLGELFRDRQAETCAHPALLLPRLDLHERLKQISQVLRANADAAVSHGD